MNDNSSGVRGAPGFTPLIDTNAVAELLGLAAISLAKMRVRGDGPPYVQIGRAIRYNPATVMAWAETRTRRSTSEATTSRKKAA